MLLIGIGALTRRDRVRRFYLCNESGVFDGINLTIWQSS